MNFFSYRHFESEALSKSQRQMSMESRIWRLEKFKLLSNGNITNKIPFLDVYGDINLVIMWPTRFISPYTSKNGTCIFMLNKTLLRASASLLPVLSPWRSLHWWPHPPQPDISHPICNDPPPSFWSHNPLLLFFESTLVYHDVLIGTENKKTNYYNSIYQVFKYTQNPNNSITKT